MSLFNCMTKVFSPDLSSSSLVLPCWGWILWTKMWRFSGTIFWLAMLIPGKLSLKLQYNGWVWTGYREVLCRQGNSQEQCKNNNNNYELEIGLLSCRLCKIWKENIKMGNEERVNQIQDNKDIAVVAGCTECPSNAPQDTLLPLAEIYLAWPLS